MAIATVRLPASAKPGRAIGRFKAVRQMAWVAAALPLELLGFRNLLRLALGCCFLETCRIYGFLL